MDFFEWILLLARWLHITVAVTWIGTSIFFMWLDRSFKRNAESKNAGHVGEVWMVHGGGFYHVEKLLMGPTKVPDHLHWFKWESYWTWLSGFSLLTLIFYIGDGTFLLDSSVSSITYWPAVALCLFSIFGSWFFYDFLWELKLTREVPLIGHTMTLIWFVAMDFILCHTLSGRAAYMHIGGMLGTWMTANVFMRIIPRQLLMVEASRKGEAVNQEWGKNAKNRSTHNTYFTLPVIFIMLSNHFPGTYGHEANWLILLGMSAAGAAIREYFVKRIDLPSRSKKFLVAGVAMLAFVIVFSRGPVVESSSAPHVEAAVKKVEPVVAATPVAGNTPSAAVAVAPSTSTSSVTGVISFIGNPPPGKKLSLPSGCNGNGDVYSNEVIVTNGKLQNVLVRISKGLEGKTYKNDIPASTIELNQKNCQYIPRVVAIHTGQKMDFINSDPVFHNIRSVTALNKNFNLPMPKKDQRITMQFDRPEVFMHSKCSIHPWMGAAIAVIDHPFFATTDEKGAFKIEGLPAGTYTLEATHEIFGTQTKEITVNGNPQAVDFSFKGN
jgi:uncharacterized membrane protein/plastocyanin